MRTFVAGLLLAGLRLCAAGQAIDAGNAGKINDLVHTRLDLRFDYAHRWVYGKAEITLQPHFYPTDSLTLDARQMSIATVEVLGSGAPRPLAFTYDGWSLRVRLPHVYRRGERYAVRVVYVAKPAEAKVADDQRGLYFINPDGTEPGKPTEIWTDSEADKASLWFPTIDRPDEKSTEEMVLTVPDRYVTLSNGFLAGRVRHGDGTRTDDWKMELPHSPYLFFFAVGDFAVVRDAYKGKEVSYYVEPAFTNTARGVFGETPAMIAFFQRVTGVPFPWVKYSQVVVRDLTSTAMENTTATAHAYAAQQDARDLVDGNRWEDNIAHELFHQWCGDYVTCASWSQLALNESMARLSESLWERWRHGEDAAMEELYGQLEGYLRDPGNAAKPIVRRNFASLEDLFDDVNYNKGALVLNMLRVYLGDSAFFAGLHRYLTANAFKAAEVHQLRLAMEAVSGRDLNWFFDQWFFGVGHPEVTIDYRYDPSGVAVTIAQQQGRAFAVPIVIDVYDAAGKKRYPVWLRQQRDSFYFPCQGAPLLANVDAEKMVVWAKTDHQPLRAFVYQYDHAGNFVDRREAVTACLQQPGDAAAMAVIQKALRDPYAGIRQFVLLGLARTPVSTKRAVEATVAGLARRDPNALVRRYALRLLPEYGSTYESLIIRSLDDSSYSAAGEALNALGRIDSMAGLAAARARLREKSRGTLAEEIVGTLAQWGSEEEFDVIADRFMQLPFKPRIARKFAAYLQRLHSPARVQQGTELLVRMRGRLPK